MKIYIISGEPSGDVLAASLMKGVLAKCPEAQFRGVGGESMKAIGFQTLFPIAELSVMGFFEVVPRLRMLLRRIKEVCDDIEMQQPDVIVTVDSWGFVNSVLNKLKRRKVAIPKVHYVAPHVWAWNKGRAKKIAHLVDRLMTLFPYEPPYFEKYGLQCDFVGHPVIENTIQSPVSSVEELKKCLQIPADALVMTVLPGSRHSETNKMIPLFTRTIQDLATLYPTLYLLIPTVETVAHEMEQAFGALQIPYQIVIGRTERYDAFRVSNVAIAASGTVSLELAACGTPHIIAYTFNALTNFLARIFVKIKYANLINILANKPIIPEFLLSDCRSDLITAKVIALLENADQAAEQVHDAQAALTLLKPQNKLPSERVAEVILEMGQERMP